ncbi:MAG TPA: potassium transporter TrkG [Tepidiformaceae bacterium]|nr:potassium transporter TrkG [Tepidiformaceae bacterium]
MAVESFQATAENVRRSTAIVRRRPARGVGSGILQIAAGFGIVLSVGFLLLMTPLAAADGGWTHPNTALFTATSAICVTGLVLVETSTHYSWFGDAVILVLIQIGGLGYMAGTTLVLWSLGRRLGLRDQAMLRLYYGAPTMRETASFAKAVALFTLRFEAAGAAVLFIAFWANGVPLSKAWWWAIFHAVSAFNNAGFNVTGNDMLDFSGAPAVLLTIATLIILGGLGYLPLTNAIQRRSFRKLSLDSKLIFVASGILFLSGWLFTSVMEWNNDATLGGLPVEDRPVVSLFHSTNSRTAGFSAIEQSELHDGTKVATIGLMFVGGAAGSTAGGLKVGAFILLLVVMVATIRGQEDVSVFRRRIPEQVIQQAATLALYFVALVFGFSLLLSATTDKDFINVIFEAVSGLCTVGLSAAGTPSFGTDGHYVLMVAMLVGRFSPLMIVLYMTKPRRKLNFQHPIDSVRLG